MKIVHKLQNKNTQKLKKPIKPLKKLNGKVLVLFKGTFGRCGLALEIPRG